MWVHQHLPHPDTGVSIATAPALRLPHSLTPIFCPSHTTLHLSSAPPTFSRIGRNPSKEAWLEDPGRSARLEEAPGDGLDVNQSSRFLLEKK